MRIYLNDFSGLGSACLAVAVLRAIEAGAPEVAYTYPDNPLLASPSGRAAAGLRRLIATSPPHWRRFERRDWADIAGFLRAQRVDTFINFRNPDLRVDPRYRQFQDWCRERGPALRWLDYYQDDPEALARRHVYDRMTDLLARAGVSCAPLDVTWLLNLRLVHHADRPVVGLFATASTSSKRWPAEFWQATAVHLAARSAADIVVFAGATPDERLAAADLCDALRLRLTDRVRLALPGSIDRLLANIAGLSLLISNDTGAGHIAAACGTPLVSVFLSTNPMVWAPRTPRSRYVLSRVGAACPQQRPTQGNCTRHYDHCAAPCGWDLRPDQVASTALALLTREEAA